MSIELVNKNKYGNEVDLWAFGVIVYYIFSGNFPFNDKEKKGIYDNIKNFNSQKVIIK